MTHTAEIDAGRAAMVENAVAHVAAVEQHYALMQNSDREGDFVCFCGLPWTSGDVGCVVLQGARLAAKYLTHSVTPPEVSTL